MVKIDVFLHGSQAEAKVKERESLHTYTQKESVVPNNTFATCRALPLKDSAHIYIYDKNSLALPMNYHYRMLPRRFSVAEE